MDKTKAKLREVIYCNWCEEEINSCDDCNSPFTDSDIVYCQDNGSRHYCENCKD